MRTAKGFSIENYLSVKLLLLLAVRKQELVGARIAEFDLDNAVWALPAERCLNHKIDGVPGIYNQHAYFNERREALAKWAAVVEACATPGSNVIPMTGRQRRPV